MTLLITGANRPLGRLAAAHFGRTHEVRRVDAMTPQSAHNFREPAVAASLVEGVDAILHLDVYDPAPLQGPQAEKDRLDFAARGTYVLMQEARQAGVARVVLASCMDLFESYPDDYVIDETWQPEPQPQADSLAPYLAELTCREFARQGGICAIGVRFGALGKQEGTTEADALTALEGALKMELPAMGYRWHVFHVCSGKRFAMRAARSALGFAREVG